MSAEALSFFTVSKTLPVVVPMARSSMSPEPLRVSVRSAFATPQSRTVLLAAVAFTRFEKSSVTVSSSAPAFTSMSDAARRMPPGAWIFPCTVMVPSRFRGIRPASRFLKFELPQGCSRLMKSLKKSSSAAMPVKRPALITPDAPTVIPLGEMKSRCPPIVPPFRAFTVPFTSMRSRTKLKSVSAVCPPFSNFMLAMCP